MQKRKIHHRDPTEIGKKLCITENIKTQKTKKENLKSALLFRTGNPTGNRYLTIDFKWAILKTLPGGGAGSVPDLRDSGKMNE